TLKRFHLIAPEFDDFHRKGPYARACSACNRRDWRQLAGAGMWASVASGVQRGDPAPGDTATMGVHGRTLGQSSRRTQPVSFGLLHRVSVSLHLGYDPEVAQLGQCELCTAEMPVRFRPSRSMDNEGPPQGGPSG